MNYLINIYNKIEKDLEKEPNKKNKSLSRIKVLDNGNKFIFIVNRNRIRSMGIKIKNNNFIKSDFPRWKGMKYKFDSIKDDLVDYSDFIIFEQTQEDKNHIFEMIMYDLLKNIAQIKKYDSIECTIKSLLYKWKKFFNIQSDGVMSDIKQQGLYSELIVLKKLISIYGRNALNYWSGYNGETHDFYIKNNAIEVKSSSKKAPYKVTISSEYQLDDTDISGELFLTFFAVKKSGYYGKNLPDIVNEIEELLLDKEQDIDKFREHLFEYGYLYNYPELYNNYFSVRKNLSYKVEKLFPRILKLDLPKGIGGISYNLSLDACENFMIDEEDLYVKVGDN
ncbi:PD-(D/E)XK motif protein [Intestinibacter bartlettii]|uniref:PD-(D/E)XK motif protein n=1 Tax=Intestinibacter bartlettii TaxID=261299 RepID=UPI0024302A25|nr:PD-(D/E)XK motif protein [Intestinibacter bartlettii]MDU6823609.1 PD-(D/E)XK motif protein [Intestinibacter bartlettii]